MEEVIGNATEEHEANVEAIKNGIKSVGTTIHNVLVGSGANP
jgi:hypothetical protein